MNGVCARVCVCACARVRMCVSQYWRYFCLRGAFPGFKGIAFKLKKLYLACERNVYIVKTGKINGPKWNINSVNINNILNTKYIKVQYGNPKNYKSQV